MSDNLPGLFTGPIGDQDTEAQGTALVQATGGEAFSAGLGHAIAENPTWRLARLYARTVDMNPVPMTPDEANAEFGVAGRLKFSEPTTRRIAQDLYTHHNDQALRENTIARGEGRTGAGGLAQFGAGLAAGIVDPLNVATAFIPFVGEARVAALLGSAGRTAAARLGVRALTGAAEGAVGAAAIEPLNYALARADQDDYDMGDVLVNLAFGAGLGAAGRAGVGALRDRAGGVANYSPDVHEAGLRQAAAAVVDGAPVRANVALDMTAAAEARVELGRWYKSTRQAFDRVDEAIGAAAKAGDARAEVNTALERLRAEVGDLRQEATINRSTTDGTELDAARAATQADALEGRAAQQDAAAAPLEQDRRALDAQERDAYGLADARTAEANARFALAQDLAERTVRRYAGARMVSLAEGEAATLAGRLLNAAPADAAKVLDEVLAAIGEKPRSTVNQLIAEGRGMAASEARAAEAVQKLRDVEDRATKALNETTTPSQAPVEVEALRVTQAAADRAPKVDGDMAKELAELDKFNTDLGDALLAQDKQRMDAAKAAGQDPKPDVEIEAAMNLAKEADVLAKGIEAAAVCQIGRA